MDGVNKMIVAKNKFQMDGNNVLAPEEPFRERRYEELEKTRKQVNKSKRQKEMKKKKSVLTNIFIAFIVGMVIIARYCMIYSYQEANIKAKTEIDALGKENDAYEVNLIKFRNISYIEETATKKLHMVKPKIGDVQYLNLSKNNIVTNDVSKVRISNDVLNKIKNVIF